MEVFPSMAKEEITVSDSVMSSYSFDIQQVQQGGPESVVKCVFMLEWGWGDSCVSAFPNAAVSCYLSGG